MDPQTEWVIRKEYAKRHGMKPLLIFLVILIMITTVTVGRALENFLRTGDFDIPQHTVGGRK
jgi:urea transporter